MPSTRPDRASDMGEAWGNWIASLGEWHVFGALTYDQNRRLRMAVHNGSGMPGADVARAHVRRWLSEGSRLLGRPIEAGVVALEYQKNGWPHFHPLLRIAGGLTGNEFRTLGQAWFRRHGYARLEVPRDQGDVAAYAAKYLSKDLSRGDVLFWPVRGRLSDHQPSLANAAG